MTPEEHVGSQYLWSLALIDPGGHPAEKPGHEGLLRQKIRALREITVRSGVRDCRESAEAMDF